MPTKSGEEGVRAPQFLAVLQALAARAGGAAPLPPVPDTRFVEDLSRLAGNEQLAAILEAKGEIDTALKAWAALVDRVEGRQRTWDLVVAFCRHADGELKIAEEAGCNLARSRSNGRC